MKALNQAERNNLYLKFLLLFTITVSITVFAIFFDFKLPAKLNDAQRQKLKAYNSFNQNQKKITKMIDTLNHQIENLGNSSKDWSIEKDQVAKQIDFKELSSDTTGNSLLMKLNTTFYSFLNAKVKALEYKDKLDESKNKSLEQEKMNKEKMDLLEMKADMNKAEAK